MSKLLAEKSQAPELSACVAAWNAKEQARVAAEDAAKAAKASTPEAIKRAETARAYREAHKEELAAKARDRRARERAERRLARYLALGGDKPALTEAERQLRIQNNAQLLT